MMQKRTKYILMSLLLLSIFAASQAQDLTIKVWPQGAPEANQAPSEERTTMNGVMRVENIS